MAKRKHRFKNTAKTVCLVTSLGMVISFQAAANKIDGLISYSPKEITQMGPVIPSGEAKWFINTENTFDSFGGTVTYFDPNGGGPDTFALGSMGHGIDGFGSDIPINVVGIESVVTGIKNDNLVVNALDEGFMSLDYNTRSGAFGETLQPERVDTSKAVDIAWPAVGSAQILTTVNENGPQYYDITITEVKENGVTPWSPHSDFRFEFDKDLQSAGGMSGSPIIQGGKLVGALSATLETNHSVSFGVSAADMITAQKRVMDEQQPKISLRKIVAGNKGLAKFLWLLSAAGLSVPALGPLYKKLGKKIGANLEKRFGLMDDPER